MMIWWSAVARHSFIGLLAASVVALLAEPSHAQFVSYDNFNSGFIDPEKWFGTSSGGDFNAPTAEFIRDVENGALHLKLVSWGGTASDTDRVFTENGLRVRQLGTLGGSGFITGLQANVTVLGVVNQDCVANTSGSGSRVYVSGSFFNDGSSSGPGDSTGDIIARFQLNNDVDGVPRIAGAVFRCSSTSCPFLATLPGNGPIFTTGWSLNTPLKLKMVWDQVNGKFTFSVVNPVTLAHESVSVVYQGVLTDAGPPVVYNYKDVNVLNFVENCTTGRKKIATDVLIDNFKVRRAP